MATISQLDFIRRYTSVSCDSYDVTTVKEFGPFVNCTSNQAIIHVEFTKDSNKVILVEAAKLACKYDNDPGSDNCVKYGVRVAMVLLALRVLPYLSGCVLLQSSMHAAFSQDETVEDALQITRLFKQLSPDTSPERICIKIPATYEGLEACRILNAKGVNTLATCVFCVEQGILASEAGCRYLSPYVNELKVHFTPGMIDENKLFPTIRQIYDYYEHGGSATQIILGSFVSSEEVIEVSGIHGVTLPPAILKEMSSTTISAETTPAYTPNISTANGKIHNESLSLDNKESFYKETLSGNKEAARKLNEAIEFFLSVEKQLEDIMRNILRELQVSGQ